MQSRVPGEANQMNQAMLTVPGQKGSGSVSEVSHGVPPKLLYHTLGPQHLTSNS